MRSIALISILIITVASSSVCSAQKTTLQGTIMSPEHDSVAVWYMHGEGHDQFQKMLGEAPVGKDGRFKLHFDLDSARALVFTDGNEVTNLFMLPGESLDISLHTAYFDETIRYTGDGAGRNNALVSLALAAENDMITNTLFAFEQSADAAALDQRIDARSAELDRLIDSMVRTYPEMTMFLNAQRAQQAGAAKWSKRSIPESVRFATARRESVGQLAKDIAGVTVSGDTMRLSQFKGKTTVLDLWATWCGPCQMEMPSWAQLEEQYGASVNFVSISVWDDHEKWKARTKELGHKHSMFIPKDRLEQLAPYVVSSIPRYMVIDKDLRVVTIDAPRPSSPDLVKFLK